MKKLTCLLVLIFSALNGFSYTVYLPGLTDDNPELWAQGYSVTATSRGFESLFTNPAGLPRGRDLELVVSVNGSAISPLSNITLFYQDINNGTFTGFSPTSPNFSNFVDAATQLLTVAGLGMSASLKAGLEIYGFGIGTDISLLTYAKGSTFLGAQATVDIQAEVVAGWGYRFNLNPFFINFGLDLKAIQRYYLTPSVLDLLNYLANTGGTANNLMILNGFKGAIDIGVIAEWGPLALGLSARDLGTQFSFKQNSISELISGLGFPGATSLASTAYTADTNTYVTAPTISAGLSFHPELGGFKSVLDPEISVDYQLPFTDANNVYSPWTMIHLGATARLIDFIQVSAGLNQGYFSFGFGTSIGPWKVNCAVYNVEMGKNIGDATRPVVAIQTDLVF